EVLWEITKGIHLLIDPQAIIHVIFITPPQRKDLQLLIDPEYVPAVHAGNRLRHPLVYRLVIHLENIIGINSRGSGCYMNMRKERKTRMQIEVYLSSGIGHQVLGKPFKIIQQLFVLPPRSTKK